MLWLAYPDMAMHHALMLTEAILILFDKKGFCHLGNIHTAELSVPLQTIMRLGRAAATITTMLMEEEEIAAPEAIAPPAATASLCSRPSSLTILGTVEHLPTRHLFSHVRIQHCHSLSQRNGPQMLLI